MQQRCCGRSWLWIQVNEPSPLRESNKVEKHKETNVLLVFELMKNGGVDNGEYDEYDVDNCEYDEYDEYDECDGGWVVKERCGVRGSTASGGVMS